jgi:hypothetical protein
LIERSCDLRSAWRRPFARTVIQVEFLGGRSASDVSGGDEAVVEVTRRSKPNRIRHVKAPMVLRLSNAIGRQPELASGRIAQQDVAGQVRLPAHEGVAEIGSDESGVTRGFRRAVDKRFFLRRTVVEQGVELDRAPADGNHNSERRHDTDQRLGASYAEDRKRRRGAQDQSDRADRRAGKVVAPEEDGDQIRAEHDREPDAEHQRERLLIAAEGLPQLS